MLLIFFLLLLIFLVSAFVIPVPISENPKDTNLQSAICYEPTVEGEEVLELVRSNKGGNFTDYEVVLVSTDDDNNLLLCEQTVLIYDKDTCELLHEIPIETDHAPGNALMEFDVFSPDHSADIYMVYHLHPRVWYERYIYIEPFREVIYMLASPMYYDENGQVVFGEYKELLYDSNQSDEATAVLGRVSSKLTDDVLVLYDESFITTRGNYGIPFTDCETSDFVREPVSSFALDSIAPIYEIPKTFDSVFTDILLSDDFDLTEDSCSERDTMSVSGKPFYDTQFSNGTVTCRVQGWYDINWIDTDVQTADGYIKHEVIGCK